MFLLFSMCLLFVSYGIWAVVFHGMQAPRLDVGGGMFFPEFFLFGDARFAKGREEGTW
jgi:hypothetical protein